MLLAILLHLQNSTGSDGTAVVFCFSIVVIIAIAIIIGNSTRNQRAQAVQKPWRDYQNSLVYLKAHPTDSEVRQGTLEYGRRYSNVTRNSKGVTIFDEVALMNDINAACGGTTAITEKAPAISEVKSPSQSQTIEVRLGKLAELRNSALITEREYDSRRQKILDEI
jgi:hypothetical protein